jgi:hypothetical protein
LVTRSFTAEHERAFHTDGYVFIRNLSDAEETQLLRAAICGVGTKIAFGVLFHTAPPKRSAVPYRARRYSPEKYSESKICDLPIKW